MAGEARNVRQDVDRGCPRLQPVAKTLASVKPAKDLRMAWFDVLMNIARLCLDRAYNSWGSTCLYHRRSRSGVLPEGTPWRATFFPFSWTASDVISITVSRRSNSRYTPISRPTAMRHVMQIHIYTPTALANALAERPLCFPDECESHDRCRIGARRPPIHGI